MNLSSDWKGVCGDASLAIWTGTTFGQCFATVAFSLPSHVLAIIVSCFFLGRYGKRSASLGRSVYFSQLPFPRLCSYCTQVILTLLVMLPLVKLTVVIVTASGKLDSLTEDIMLMLMFCYWAISLTYYRRLHTSRYFEFPGLVLITVFNAIIFIAQFPVILSFDNDLYSALTKSLDFVFLVIYEVLIFLALLSYVVVISRAKYLLYNLAPIRLLDEPSIQSGSLYNISHASDVPTHIERTKNILCRLFFWDAFSLLRFGRKHGFDSVESLIRLPKKLGSAFLLRTFLKAFDRSMLKVAAENFDDSPCFHGSTYLDDTNSQVSLLKILFNSFGLKFFMIGILRLLSDSLSFFAPFLLGKLTTFVSDATEPLSYGGALAGGLFVASFLAAITNAWFSYLIQCITMQVRASLTVATFAKTLVTPHTILNAEFNAGQIMTFLSTDTDRVANMLPSFHSLWSLPFQIGVAFYLLYAQLGLYFLAGVVFAVVIIPINFLICRKIMSLTKEMLAAKDDRVKICSEMLQGMKAIKLYAWESFFASKIASIRVVELWRCLKGRKLLDAFCVYFWATTPLLMQLSTFVTFIFLSGQPLTASRVYTSIALFNMLLAPLNAFPWVVNGMIDGIVSLRRIEKFFRITQFRVDGRDNRESSLIPRPKYFCAASHSSADVAVNVKAPAVFAFPVKKCIESSNSAPTFQLKLNSDFTVPPGSLVCVLGDLGSGKSAFLLSLAGELIRESGSVFISGAENCGIGFAPQQPWLVSGSIRHNILFGRPFDANRYEKIIDATALRHDLNQMVAGDRTDVGEDGSALSGGQKQRVGIARAIYDEKHSIYLLDDPFASVDGKVARHILNRCIYKLLIEERRASVVMATNRLDIASQADFVVSLGKSGVVEAIGKPQHVLGQRWLSSNVNVESPRDTEDSGATTIKPGAISDSAGDGDDDTERAEESRHGTVKLHVWRSYAKAAGYGWSLLALVTLLLMQGSRNAADIWLARWVDDTSQNNTTNSTSQETTDFYLTVYGAIGGANSVFALARAFSFAYMGLFAAGFLHEKLLASVLNAPLNFFESTPIGRVLNRFTADVWACDDSVPFELNILLAQSVGLIGTLATITYAAPITLAVVAPLAVIYFFLQRFYRFSSRSLKRLQMTSQSPIYSHATSHALTGNSIPVIRSLALENSVLETNMRLVDANQRVQFSSLLANQWLSTTLQLMGVFAVGACCAAAIIQHWRGTSNASLVGLSLSYALSLTGFLSGLIGSFTETEKQMISIERVNQYIDDLPTEASDGDETTYNGSSVDDRRRAGSQILETNDAPVLSFKNVWLRYRPTDPYALCGISLSIKQGERVAICGRTGAGKSSLFAALFRLASLDRGVIEVSGRDISTLSKQRLRCLLASVPQEPIVFSGSVRFNLDPGNMVSDQVLLKALELAQLSAVLQRLAPNNSSDDRTRHLDFDVGERGVRLSLGERQLLCVARALASSTAIMLCADEPTASIDSATESSVISALCRGAAASVQEEDADTYGLPRHRAGRRALLMIAHRLNNVLADGAFDRVIVVDGGVVIENGPPRELLANPASALSRLINAPNANTTDASANDNNNNNNNNNSNQESESTYISTTDATAAEDKDETALLIIDDAEK